MKARFALLLLLALVFVMVVSACGGGDDDDGDNGGSNGNAVRNAESFVQGLAAADADRVKGAACEDLHDDIDRMFEGENTQTTIENLDCKIPEFVEGGPDIDLVACTFVSDGADEEWGLIYDGRAKICGIAGSDLIQAYQVPVSTLTEDFLAALGSRDMRQAEQFICPDMTSVIENAIQAWGVFESFGILETNCGPAEEGEDGSVYEGEICRYTVAMTYGRQSITRRVFNHAFDIDGEVVCDLDAISSTQFVTAAVPTEEDTPTVLLENPDVTVFFLEALHNQDAAVAKTFACEDIYDDIDQIIASVRTFDSFSILELTCQDAGGAVNCTYSMQAERGDESFSREFFNQTFAVEDGKVCSLDILSEAGDETG